MAQKVAEEEEWGKCLVAEGRAIDVMISINLERGWIEDLEYNIADQVENQETDVVGMKQEIFEYVPSGDMVAAIEEIKEEDPEQAISESGDEKSLRENVLKVEVSGQSSTISRSITSLDQIKYC
uniref:Uncharacterized protein n=1 Tax=Solanum tuberosum TaxID=4113 RepID=M1BGY3_SOLTU